MKIERLGADFRRLRRDFQGSVIMGLRRAMLSALGVSRHARKRHYWPGQSHAFGPQKVIRLFA